MAHNEHLAARVRAILDGQRVEEKSMMGGLMFMVNGKMCVGVGVGVGVGVVKYDLMARIGPQNHAAALQRKGCLEMDFTGRPMRGYVFVGAEGTRGAKEPKHWVTLALAFNKEAKASRK